MPHPHTCPWGQSAPGTVPVKAARHPGGLQRTPDEAPFGRHNHIVPCPCPTEQICTRDMIHNVGHVFLSVCGHVSVGCCWLPSYPCIVTYNHSTPHQSTSYQIRNTVRCACTGMPGTFSRHRLQRKSSVSDPGMRHACAWCMSGSQTFPVFPAHAQPAILRHLARGPWVVGKCLSQATFMAFLKYW